MASGAQMRVAPEQRRSWKTEFVATGEHPNRAAPAYPEQQKLLRSAFLRVNIFQLSDINTVACTYTAEFFLTLTWLEPTLQYDELAAMDAEKQAAAIREAFEPQLEFMNAAGAPEIAEGPDFELVSWRRGQDGSPAVCLRKRVIASFYEQFELSWFPFDAQPLNVIFTSKHRTDALSLYGEAENSRVRTEFMVMPEFALSPVSFCAAQTGSRAASSRAIGYPLLYAGVVGTRRFGYYVWNVFAPTLLLTVMSVATFAVPVADVADRLSVILTLVLTSVAFKFVVAQSLPKISYNTFLDYYVLLSFILLTAIVVHCVVVGYVTDGGDEDTARSADNVMVWVVVGAFGFWHVVSIAAVFRQLKLRSCRAAIGPSTEALASGRVVLAE